MLINSKQEHTKIHCLNFLIVLHILFAVEGKPFVQILESFPLSYHSVACIEWKHTYVSIVLKC